MRLKFLKIFSILLLVAFLFQLYIQRTNNLGLWDSIYSALCYSFPVALVTSLILVFVAKSRNSDD